MKPVTDKEMREYLEELEEQADEVHAVAIIIGVSFLGALSILVVGALCEKL